MLKKLKNDYGFTLIEMLIVLLIISILIILIIPNLTGKTKDVHNKGCKALKSVIQTQIDAYQLDKGSLPSNIQTLVTNNYISDEQTTCPNNKSLNIVNGKVVESK